MTLLIKEVSQAWDYREGPLIIVTDDHVGIPQAIYASWVSKYDEATRVVAGNYFNKTGKNILSGCQVSLLCRKRD